jgi:hypothetical protein
MQWDLLDIIQDEKGRARVLIRIEGKIETTARLTPQALEKIDREGPEVGGFALWKISKRGDDPTDRFWVVGVLGEGEPLEVEP